MFGESFRLIFILPFDPCPFFARLDDSFAASANKLWILRFSKEDMVVFGKSSGVRRPIVGLVGGAHLQTSREEREGFETCRS